MPLISSFPSGTGSGGGVDISYDISVESSSVSPSIWSGEEAPFTVNLMEPNAENADMIFLQLHPDSSLAQYSAVARAGLTAVQNGSNPSVIVLSAKREIPDTTFTIQIITMTKKSSA